MAKKSDNSTTTDDSTPDSEDEVELLQVDLGDMIKMKQVLDETVSAAVLDQDIPEDYHWDNCKLGIMFLSCLFAMIAQFAPLPFPDSRPVLGACGVMYFVLSGVLQLITTFIDMDCILLTLPGADSQNKTFKEYGLRVRSSMPRFSEFYTVILEFQDYAKKTGKTSPVCSQEWSVGQFFDKEGYFDEVGVCDEVAKVVKRLKSGQYDKTDSSNKQKKQ